MKRGVKKVNSIIDNSVSYHTKYSNYRFIECEGILYIAPTSDAELKFYDVFKVADKILVDALTVGRICIENDSDIVIQSFIKNFVRKYGLLGIITDLATTPLFMEFDEVYLMKNLFINKDKMKTSEYLKYFAPFTDWDFESLKKEGQWDFKGELKFKIFGNPHEPIATTFESLPIYAERYDWLKSIFSSFAYNFNNTTAFYEKYDVMNDEEREFYSRCAGFFERISPTYYVELTDRPIIRWKSNSLLTMLRMIFALKLTDSKKSLRRCKHCRRAFICSRPNQVFCTEKCKNQYNVYNHRKKKKAETESEK